MGVRVTRPKPGDWSLRARCRMPGTPDMFPESTKGVNEAVRWCHGCPVMAECADHALAAREKTGVWGGMSERERSRRIKASAAMSAVYDWEVGA